MLDAKFKSALDLYEAAKYATKQVTEERLLACHNTGLDEFETAKMLHRNLHTILQLITKETESLVAIKRLPNTNFDLYDGLKRDQAEELSCIRLEMLSETYSELKKKFDTL